MFAVVKTGGKQYKVSEGDYIVVEKLAGEAGDNVTLSDVLTLGGDKPQVGAPLIEGASVAAEIVKQAKGDKVIVFKKKRRHNYRRKIGHRQLETTLKITGISASGGAKAAPAKKAEAAPAKAETKAAAKPAAEKKPAAKKAAAKKDS